MSLTEIFTIIIIHWIADFIMQDEKWALGKSKNWKDLLEHTYDYKFVNKFSESDNDELPANNYEVVLEEIKQLLKS